MSHPHTTQADRDAIEDRGLVDDPDRTEGLRSSKKNAPGRCANTAEGRNHQLPISRKEVQS